MESKDKLSTSEDFFNSISGFYDGMINFSSALQKRKDLIKKFISDKVRNAADLGCGTGLDSIALSMNGVDVTGFDVSEEMINKAKENSTAAGFNIEFHKSSLDKIPSAFYNKFDLVLSLGNTLANLNEKKLDTTISKINKLLRKDGKVIIQILNYAKLIKDNERILNINSSGDEIIIRFYDFYLSHINFNILKINMANLSQRQLFTTPLFPHSKENIIKLLKDKNFRKIKSYGDLSLIPYKKYISKDFIIIAEK